MSKLDFTGIDVNYLIWCLFIRYRSVWLPIDNSIHLRLEDDVRKLLYDGMGVQIEMFGNAFNAGTDRFCSLFPDVEQYFGSVGNHFDVIVERGITYYNFPFTNDIMEKSLTRLKDIADSGIPVKAVFVYPLWDNPGRKKLKSMGYDIDIQEYPPYLPLKYAMEFPKQHTFAYPSGELGFYGTNDPTHIIYPCPLYITTVGGLPASVDIIPDKKTVYKLP